MKNNKDTLAEQPGKFLEELHALVNEAEKLIGNVDKASGPVDLSALRNRFEAAQTRFSEFYDDARKQVVAGARCTDTAIRDNPYQSLAIMTGIALVAGLLLGRRGA